MVYIIPVKLKTRPGYFRANEAENYMKQIRAGAFHFETIHYVRSTGELVAVSYYKEDIPKAISHSKEELNSHGLEPLYGSTKQVPVSWLREKLGWVRQGAVIRHKQNLLDRAMHYIH